MWADSSETKILYVQTHGIDDPGRSATPFSLLQRRLRWSSRS